MAKQRILYVIPPVDFRDEELFEPYTYFTQEMGWDVTVSSTQTGEAKGMLGKTYSVTELVSNQSAGNYDAIVIAGGMGSPTYLWSDTHVLNLVKSFYSQNKLVASICLSGAVLANAGILEGKKATVWEAPESLKAFEAGKAIYVKEDVVIDGKIITSPGPHAATPFAKAIANALQLVAS